MGEWVAFWGHGHHRVTGARFPRYSLVGWLEQTEGHKIQLAQGDLAPQRVRHTARDLNLDATGHHLFDNRHHTTIRDAIADADPQRARFGLSQVAHLGVQVLSREVHVLGQLEKCRADFGGSHTPRQSLEQVHLGLPLKASDGLAHSTRRQAQADGCGGHAFFAPHHNSNVEIIQVHGFPIWKRFSQYFDCTCGVLFLESAWLNHFYNSGDIHMNMQKALSYLTACALTTTLFWGAPTAWSQDTFPSRPVTVIVPFGPGSGTDIVARILAKGMSEQLQVPVIVDNKVGANGAIGAQAAAKAKADGYTLVIGSATTHAVNFGFFPGKLGYEPEQFQGVGGLSFSPVSLYVEASSPWKSIADLVTDAKRNPGKYNCGSGNAVTQVACEMFRQEAGIQATNIPYKSNPQSLTDVAGKQVSYAFSDGGAAQAFVEGKRLRPLAVAAAVRNVTMPDVLTFREQGMPHLEFTAWVAVFAPTGVPAPVLERLNAAVRKATEVPEMIQQVSKSGGTAMRFNSSTEVQTFYKAEVTRWAKYVKDSGVKPEQ